MYMSVPVRPLSWSWALATCSWPGTGPCEPPLLLSLSLSVGTLHSALVSAAVAHTWAHRTSNSAYMHTGGCEDEHAARAAYADQRRSEAGQPPCSPGLLKQSSSAMQRVCVCVYVCVCVCVWNAPHQGLWRRHAWLARVPWDCGASVVTTQPINSHTDPW